MFVKNVDIDELHENVRIGLNSIISTNAKTFEMNMEIMLEKSDVMCRFKSVYGIILVYMRYKNKFETRGFFFFRDFSDITEIIVIHSK